MKRIKKELRNCSWQAKLQRAKEGKKNLFGAVIVWVSKKLEEFFFLQQWNWTSGAKNKHSSSSSSNEMATTDEKLILFISAFRWSVFGGFTLKNNIVSPLSLVIWIYSCWQCMSLSLYPPPIPLSFLILFTLSPGWMAQFCWFSI